MEQDITWYEAARNTGVLLQANGDTEGARAAFQQAIDSGHAEQMPKAELNLGVLLQGQGDRDGAIAAYQQAIGSAAPMWRRRPLVT